MKKSRTAAAQAGEDKYKTGKPCKHGHNSARYTKNGMCVQCSIDGSKAHTQMIRATLAFNSPDNQE